MMLTVWTGPVMYMVSSMFDATTALSICSRSGCTLDDLAARSESERVSAGGWAGLVLILVGLLEFVLFRFVFANAAGIRGHMRLLMLNCAFNLVAGAVLLIIGLR
jgi:hypothetical protein